MQQTGSFNTHPALLDAMTHVVAALQTQEKQQDTPQITRVPSAIDVFIPAATTPGGGPGAAALSSCCIGAFEEMLEDDTAVSSFRMAAGSGTGLGRFHAKPVRANISGVAALTAVTAAARLFLRAGLRSNTSNPSSSTAVAAASAAAPFRSSKRRELRAISNEVQKLVNKMLGVDVTPDQPLMEAGMDSLGAVELRTALNKAFNVELPATVTFDFPTVNALAGCINTELEMVAQQEEEEEEIQHQASRQAAAAAAAVASAAAVARAAVASTSSATARQTLPPQNQQQKVSLSSAEINRKVAITVQKLLGAEVAPDQPLMEAGLDSLGAVELRTALNGAFHVDLPATVTFDYPTIAALSAFIAANLEEFQIEDEEEALEIPAVTEIQHSPSRDMPIGLAELKLVQQTITPGSTAVVGISALYPTNSPLPTSVPGVAAFAQGMKASEDFPRRIPLEVIIIICN